MYVLRKRDVWFLKSKVNVKSYVLYQTVTMLIILSDINHPKITRFDFGSSFISLQLLKPQSSNCVHT